MKNLVRIVFLGLAVLLPVSWTVAKAGDDAPSTTETKTKKTKKSKKNADGSKTDTETKSETKTDK